MPVRSVVIIKKKIELEDINIIPYFTHAQIAGEQALYSGGQRELFSLRIIFFESAEGASFGERSEGERSEPAVKNESLHVSH